jgi:hypothetical protein
MGNNYTFLFLIEDYSDDIDSSKILEKVLNSEVNQLKKELLIEEKPVPSSLTQKIMEWARLLEK